MFDIAPSTSNIQDPTFDVDVEMSFIGVPM